MPRTLIIRDRSCLYLSIISSFFPFFLICCYCFFFHLFLPLNACICLFFLFLFIFFVSSFIHFLLSSMFHTVAIRVLYSLEYTGHTQKNGAVSMYIIWIPHHSFVYTLYRAYTKEWCGFKRIHYWYRTILLCMPCTGIHKRMVRFQNNSLLIPHHSFVYALYLRLNRNPYLLRNEISVRPSYSTMNTRYSGIWTKSH
jgi:hypothetical protein